MLEREFDLNVPQTELDKAKIWWRSLSINEMNELNKKYFPDTPWTALGKRHYHQMWEEENKT